MREKTSEDGVHNTDDDGDGGDVDERVELKMHSIANC